MLGFKTVDMKTDGNHTIYQKTIYLLQNYGVSLGYGFEWRVRGPYSPQLHSDLEALHYIIHPEEKYARTE